MKRLCILTLLLGFALTCVAQPVQSATDDSSQALFGAIEKELPAISLMPADSIIYLADRLISIMETKEDSTRMAGVFFDYFSD